METTGLLSGFLFKSGLQARKSWLAQLLPQSINIFFSSGIFSICDGLDLIAEVRAFLVQSCFREISLLRSGETSRVEDTLYVLVISPCHDLR